MFSAAVTPLGPGTATQISTWAANVVDNVQTSTIYDMKEKAGSVALPMETLT